MIFVILTEMICNTAQNFKHIFSKSEPPSYKKTLQLNRNYETTLSLQKKIRVRNFIPPH